MNAVKALKDYIVTLQRVPYGAPAALVIILAMLIFPMPPWMLDVLFTFNIALSLIVIMVSVNVRRPLDFSAFPTVILVATLMRLMLNVASTRAVLLNGHNGTDVAGHVVQAFGKVVIGGNFVVGFVVFVILMIINFVVVTKGGERISEVSARFTLDALPGKQMAIDADLNAGLITQEKAQQRRRDVTSEADFYGAMDGASKFVRGDAVAGVLVLVINLVGGVAIGVLMHNMSAAEAFRQYALLTIGDGLVAQIPALILSAAAAIIVTRVSDSGDFGQQLTRQLLASAPVMWSASFLVLTLGLVPGMPLLPFLGCSAILAYVGWRIQRHPITQEEQEDQEAAQALENVLLQPEHATLEWSNLPYVEPVSVTLGYRLVGLIDEAQGAALSKRLRGVRQNFSENMGFLLPSIAVRDDLGLPANSYGIFLHGTLVAQAHIHAEKLMAIASPQVYSELDGIPDVDPAYGMRVTWIDVADKTQALGLGYQVVDCATVIATHFSRVMRDHLNDLFSYDDITALIQRLGARAPALAEAFGKCMPHSLMRKIFRLLLAEGVSLKDVQTIAATLVESSEVTKDPILLAAEVRCALRRQIVSSLVGTHHELKVFALTQELENILLSSLSRAEQSNARVALDNFAVEPSVLGQMRLNMPSIEDQMKRQGLAPIVLVIPRLRPFLARYARLFGTALSVLSYNEIPDGKEINVVGTLG